MKPEPIILLDVDGVVADFASAFLDVYYQLTNIRRWADEVTDWDICRALGISKDLEREIYKAIEGPGFAYQAITPYREAPIGIQSLRKVAEPYWVTSPIHSQTWMYDRTEWLRRYFQVEPGRVIHCSAKELLRGDMLVDDKLENIDRWRGANPHGLGLLWSAPYNQGRSDLVRVHTWDQVIEYARAL